MPEQTVIPPNETDDAKGRAAYFRITQGKSRGIGRLVEFMCSLPREVYEKVEAVLVVEDRKESRKNANR